MPIHRYVMMFRLSTRRYSTRLNITEVRNRIANENPQFGQFVRQGSHVLNEEGAVMHQVPEGIANQSYFIETLGCQMNVADSEIVASVMENAGYHRTDISKDANVVFLNTCAIREHAEDKAIQRLQAFRRTARKENNRHQQIGVLGCMAERMKDKLLENSLVNVVAGPDSYRSLPQLLSIARAETQAMDVHLSIDETYADVNPVRIGPGWQAFVSISRGCNNMCTYCIVPFTRGRERSRDANSIVREIEEISKNGTIREVVLLGQNVNSYHDRSNATSDEEDTYKIASGFSDLFKSRRGGGVRFHDLLDSVASVDPKIRIRFTSPHPKDFTDEVLHVIKKHDNICKGIHLPAQSGSDNVLASMRRGYTRQAYLDLVDRARSIIGPELELSSDFISGFCGETEKDHEDTLSLLEKVKYAQAFTFAYSRREKTRAYHRLEDDVPQETKIRRLQEVIDVYRRVGLDIAQELIGKQYEVLVEGPTKKNPQIMQGRNNALRRCIIETDPGVVAPEAGTYCKVEVVEAKVSALRCKLVV